MKSFKKLLYLFTYKEPVKALLLLVMILIMALLETIGVLSILPFLALLTNPDLLETNTVLKNLYIISVSYGIKNTKEFLIFLGIFFFIIYIFSVCFKTLTLYLQIGFIMMQEYNLSKRVIKNYISRPYAWFLNQRTSNLGKTIITDINFLIYNAFLPLAAAITHGTVIITILSMLIFFNPKVVLILMILFLFFYISIFKKSRNFLNFIGKISLNSDQERQYILNQIFNAFKEIKIGSLENIFINRFTRPAKRYAISQRYAQIIMQLPRFFLEAMAFGGVLFSIIFLIEQNNNFNEFLPTIALFTFAGYRLLPSVNVVYDSITKLRFSTPTLDNIYKNLISLRQEKLENNIKSVLFKKAIFLKNVYFKYPLTSKQILKNISLTIPALSTVGIVGPTGSGKTTLVDIILGLHKVQNGTIKIDNQVIGPHNLKGWRSLIGYVPQHISLSDDTIKANIAFGVKPKNFDQKAMESAAKIANIHEFIVTQLPNKYQTFLGERGIKISGGQRQRISIARALYHKPKLLILDEATSALDVNTEKFIIDGILKNKNDLTIIIIAHRISALKKCDTILLLKEGQLKWQGSFNEWLKKQSAI